jgi:predicted flap endonuclease-1-like 5' DNA nuclease
MNGLTLLALIVLALGGIVAYRVGRLHGRQQRSPADRIATPLPAPPMTPAPATAAATLDPSPAAIALADEYGRLLRSYEAEAHALRQSLAASELHADAKVRAAGEHAAQLSGELERLRAETARYRQVIIDIENNAPPPLLDSPDAPDDLRLIVGIGPVLERLLQQLGVATYRQIAHWSERDIDDFDAKLPEFPGRIRRDDWVTQARELHMSKYGQRP